MIETRNGRPLTLGEQRKLAAELRDQRRSYAEIGAELGVSAIKARDLCGQYDRMRHLTGVRALAFELSRRAILALLTSAKAKQMGSNTQERLAKLLEIAAAHRRGQLLDEEGVGIKTVDEIETWLVSKGRAFRTRSRAVNTAPGDEAVRASFDVSLVPHATAAGLPAAPEAAAPAAI